MVITAQGSHQRLRPLGLGTVQVCEEKQQYLEVTNTTENNKK